VYEVALFPALEIAAQALPRSTGAGFSCRGGRQAAPEEVMSRRVAGSGYAVCVDFLGQKQIQRWSDERKAAVRRRNMQARINRVAPLFADELIERELAARPAYFNGKSAR
jgi:hypothetical protein